MSTYKKYLLMLLSIVLAAGVALFIRYRTTLNRSIEEGSMIVSRAVAMDTAINEIDATMPEPFADDVQTVGTGAFTRLDPIHRADGSVEVTQDGNMVYIMFDEGFTVANGPDLYVVLSKTDRYEASSALNLGTLVSKNGQQLYQVTLDEREEYGQYVMIRCRAFDVTFSVAEIDG